MCALIAMAVHDTEENNRTWMTKETVGSLLDSLVLESHNLIVVDNGSCAETKIYLKACEHLKEIDVITLDENVGTARAINKAWQKRDSDEFAVKIDNDVEIHHEYWLDECIEAIERDPTIGICALKRKDCEESPDSIHPWYKSRITMLPHKKGERWIIVEEVNHAMGTCQVYSPALLDRIGYLYQMGGLYGFDDALACIRAHVAGFKTVFLPHIEIEHIDPGETAYTAWKSSYGNLMMSKYNEYKRMYLSKEVDVYHGPDDD
jgi:GT2 family glycosyltransferase